jgi:phenylalanyl-tRNA synthetase beta chain
MLFSLEWLSQLCPVGASAAEVARVLTGRGLTVDAVDESGPTPVLDVDVPANRPDCLGHRGLAREMSAAFGVPLRPPVEPPPHGGAPLGVSFRVEVEDPADCPRYTAGLVRGVHVGPSPDWAVRRLERCGLRSVSNVVDASNLVLLELGHPIHFFDRDRLRGDARGPRTPIVVRRGRLAERLRALDGRELELDEQTLVIADGAGAIALAGVIGGADTEISPGTRDVLIEAASFDPRLVRRTARRLGVSTDASYRFERGVDAATALDAQYLAMQLLADLAGGVPAPGVLDPHQPQGKPVRHLRAQRLEQLLGYAPAPEEVVRALDALGLLPVEEPGGFRVTVPSWRSDLRLEADLVEEVARHLGYERIPLVHAGAPPSRTREVEGVEERCRDILCGQGFQEALGYAMIGAGEDDGFVPPGAPPSRVLENPIAEPLSVLRRSILPGLLRSLLLNLRRGNRDVRLFESGKVFLGADAHQLPDEPVRLGIVWSGGAGPRHWSLPDRPADLYDLAGIVDHLLGTLRPALCWERSAGSLAAFHPGRSARWSAGSAGLLAWGGALHPDLAREYEATVHAVEIDLRALAGVPDTPPQHRAQSRLPAVSRDLAVVLDASTTYQALLDVLRSVEAPAPVEFTAVDHYGGPPLAAGEVALTVRLRLQPTLETLTDPQTETYRLELVRRLAADLGVRLRA